MFISKIPDFTQVVARLSGAVEAAGESEYPGDPSVNDLVQDTELNVIRSWDGQRWVTLATRPGLGQQ